MKKTSLLRFIGLIVLIAPWITSCGDADDDMSPEDPNPLPTIQSFYVNPTAGPAPLTVEFAWNVVQAYWDEISGQWKGSDSHRCALYLIPPGADEPEPVHVGSCDNARFTKNLADLGLYKAYLIVNSRYSERDKPLQSTFDDHRVNGVDPDWPETRSLKSSVLIEVSEPAAVKAGSSANTDPSADTGVSASEWHLVETDTNPYDLSVEADLHTENASYAGSLKECKVTDGSISYQHVVKTQVADLADVMWTYEFDAPPPSVQAGETITLSHSLSVAGEVKVGGGATPSGYAAYSTEFWTPRALTVPSAAVNDDRFSTTDSDAVRFTFPTDGSWFGIEARVLDTQNPDIACDIAWWYERDDTAQP